jgi:hypothetical protein
MSNRIKQAQATARRSATTFLEHSVPNGDLDLDDALLDDGSTPPVVTDAEALQAVAQQIRKYQQSQTPPLSDAKLIQRFPSLGSAKTFRRIREGKAQDPSTGGLLDIAQWLNRYKAVMGQIRKKQLGNGAETIYADFSNALRVQAAFADLWRSEDLSSVVLVEGASGSGKTQVLKLVAASGDGTVCWTEATESWESLCTALGDLLHALDEYAIPNSMSLRLQRLTEVLRGQDRIIFIDEGEQITPRVLNVIKTLVNRTSVKFMIGANPTRKWSRLLATEEGSQILHNRLCCRVILPAMDAEHVGLYILRRLGLSLEGREWETAFGAVAGIARHNGHGAFLRKLVSRLRAALAEDPDALSSPQCLSDHAALVRSGVKGRSGADV